MGKVLVVFILDVFLSALLSLKSKLIAAAYTPSPLQPIEIISLRRDPQSQGCQLAVVMTPLLKSGRRKTKGALKNSGPQGAVEGPKKLKGPWIHNTSTKTFSDTFSL
jgi:hypothetical protein